MDFFSNSLKVGEKGCPISKICQVINSSKSALSKTFKNLHGIGYSLGTPGLTLDRIRRDISLKIITEIEAFYQVIEEWVGRCGDEATLQQLISALEENDLKCSADLLRSAFEIQFTPKKYIKAPSSVANLALKGNSVLILCTPDVSITYEKVRENVTCQKLEFEDILKSTSVIYSSTKTIFVVINTCVKELKVFLQYLTTSSLKIIFIIEKSFANEITGNGLNSSVKIQIEVDFDKITWDDLAPNHKYTIQRKLENHLEIEFEAEELPNLLTEDNLIDLINDKRLTILKDTLPPKDNFYIERTILTRYIISPDVYESNHCPDIFLFEGMERHELSKVLRNQTTAISWTEISKTTPLVRYIILAQPDHFDKICENTEHPVHWLRKDNDEKLRWVKSKGDITFLQKCVDKSAQNSIGEKEFSMKMADERPIIISDSPGMGKSKLLIEIGRYFKILSNKVVAYLQMNELIQEAVLSRKNGAVETRLMVELALKNLICRDKLGMRYLSEKLRNASSSQIELLVDGFDEIDLKHLNFAYILLTEMNEAFKNVRLWVATRPHYLYELEHKFSVLGYSIEHFQPKDQIQSLVLFWANGKQLNEKRLKFLAEKCLNFVQTKLSTKDADFAGVPLQCLLIAEVFRDDAVDFSKSQIAAGCQIEFGTHINSISKLYRTLVDQKLENYRIKYDGKGDKQELLDMHMRLSLKEVFPDYFSKSDHFKTSQIISPEEIHELLKIGILESTSNANAPRFIHRTFSEYFVAWFVAEWLSQKNVDDSFADWRPFTTFVFDNVFSRTKKQISVLGIIHSFAFNYPVVCNFLNLLLAERNLPCASALVDIFVAEWKTAKTSLKGIFHACALANHFHIFQYFENAISTKNELLKEIFNSDLLLISVMSSNLDIITTAIRQFERNYKFVYFLQINALTVAVKRGNFPICEYFLKTKMLRKYVEDFDKSIDQLLSVCINNSYKDSLEVLADKMEIVNLLVKINCKFVDFKTISGNYPVHIYNLHPQLLLQLIKLGADPFVTDVHGDTLIHYKEQHGKPEEYHAFIASLPDDIFKALINRKGRHGQNPLMRLVKMINPLPKTLQLFQTAGAQFNSIDDESYSILANAIRFGRDAATIRELIKCGSSIQWTKGWRAKYLMHYAGEYGNADAVSTLASEYSQPFNVKDWSWSTPLDYVIAPLNWSQRRGNRFDTGIALKNLGGTFTLLPGHLHVAVTKGDMDCTKLLLKFGAYVHGTDKLGNTPLHIAFASGGSKEFREIAALLLEKKANPNSINSDGHTPIYLALKSGTLDLSFLHLFLSKDLLWIPNMSTNLLSFVLSKVHVIEEEQLFKLLETCKNHGSNYGLIDDKNNSYLHLVVNMLIWMLSNLYNPENGIKKLQIRKIFKTAMHWQLICWRLLQHLIENGADPAHKNEKGNTFLGDLFRFSIFPTSQFHEISMFLIKSKHSYLFNMRGGQDGSTPLHYVVQRQRVERKTLILMKTNGVNFNSENNVGNSILAYAVIAGRSVGFLSQLISLGADWKYVNKKGSGILHHAAQLANAEVLKYLLTLDGLDVNQRDLQGNTPLHRALNGGPDRAIVLEKCEILIKSGASIQEANKLGITPLMLALSRKSLRGEMELLKILSGKENPESCPVMFENNNETNKIDEEGGLEVGSKERNEYYYITKL